MTTILADSFTAALARLTNDEQKQAKLTAFDLQVNPDQPGLQFHRIEKSRDANFWSLRVSRDLRVIVHKTGDSVMLVYVGHHDDAYTWAERRRIEAHPRTGALQIVEVRERIEDVAPRQYSQMSLALDAPPPAPALPIFAALTRDDLLSVGVPDDWLADVAQATEDAFFKLTEHLPGEAAEALLEYAATGKLPAPPPPAADPLAHPDTLRRFRILEGADELRAALDAPFEIWAVFLHPSQRAIVDRRFGGPARVAGSAGTGKTVVALHRAFRILQADRDAKVLLTTFSEPLARALKSKLAILLADRPGMIERVTVASFLEIAAQLVTLNSGHKPHLGLDETIRTALAKAAAETGITEFTPQFLYSEWTYVIDAWQIDSAEAYARVPRMGRKNRLGPRQRERLWQLFAATRQRLSDRGLNTSSGVFAAAAAAYRNAERKPFTNIVVDEAQDLGVAELRFLSAIAPDANDALFFAGDAGQRIFQQPFSWLGLGVDVRGRSSTLRVNYRTSHQIRRAADRLLPASVSDVDGLADDRAGTVSVFDGPEPRVVIAASEVEETAAVAAFLTSALTDGIAPSEIGIFVRSAAQIPRAHSAATAAGLTVRGSFESAAGALVATMHLAKGLEFRVVAVMACDQSILPLEERVTDVADEFELDEVIATERQLLYVAATRARDRLVVSGVAPGSEFLEALDAKANHDPSPS